MPPRSAKPRSAKKTAPLAQQENFDDDSEAKVISESETEKEKTLNASKNDKSKKKKTSQVQKQKKQIKKIKKIIMMALIRYLVVKMRVKMKNQQRRLLKKMFQLKKEKFLKKTSLKRNQLKEMRKLKQ